MNINKIITIASVLVLFSTNAVAQLQVDSLGHVGIATKSTSSILTVGGGGTSQYTATIKSVDRMNGLCIKNHATTGSPKGLYIMNYFTGASSSYGIRIPNNTGTMSGPSFGIFSRGGGSASKNIGVWGGIASNNSIFDSGIFGSTTYSCDHYVYPGKYAGYFYGDVRVTGTLTSASVVTPATTSNAKTMSESSSVNEYSDSELVCDRLSTVKLMEIHLDKVPLFSKELNDNPQLVSQPEDETKSEADEEFKDDETEISEQEEISNYIMPKTRYGLAADELREIYPELVYEDVSGNLSINYVEMVPLLVQSIKELKAEIDELKGVTPRKQVAPKKNGNTTSMANAESDLISLSQNDPNPFTTETTIAVTLPETVKKAAIVIYDMSGKKITQIDVIERGATSIDVTSEGLTQGMYLYSLIADGKVMSTKRMILN